VNTRPFRFSTQERRAGSAVEWRDRARLIESLGYAAFYVPDHFGDQLAPFAALQAAADATTTIRLGPLVLDNDYRHPVVVAKEAATLDLLSDGRLDFGIGAGWLISDYEEAGFQYDSPGVRIDRLAEAIHVIKGLFTGEPFSFDGKHYKIKGLEGRPLPLQRPHPPFLIGGGGRKMLQLAAREADLINVNFDLREGTRSPEVAKTGLAAVTDQKLDWIREAAGDRMDDIELGVWILQARVTEERSSLVSALAPLVGLDPAEVLDSPHLLVGTVDQIADDLVARRERYGISHVVVPGDAAEALAPVVERLTGT